MKKSDMYRRAEELDFSDDEQAYLVENVRSFTATLVFFWIAGFCIGLLVGHWVWH